MEIDRRTLVKGASAVLAASVVGPAAGAPSPDPKDYAQRLAAELTGLDKAATSGPYRADWSSLQYYPQPEWYRDAKFGIFIHWGVYAVPAFANEWYSRNMYVPGSEAFKHHIATYGPQSKFGYKDFIPKFKAEKFDANAWVDLFARAGARYVVPVAEHCDGFAMYASHLTGWNVAKMGPKRDTLGELEKAIRARGLKFGLSSHRAEHTWWYTEGTQYASDVRDPRYRGLYGPAQPMTLPADRERIKGEPNSDHLERWLPPSKAFLDDWLGRTSELMTGYKPDLMYFDWWINQTAFEPYLRRFAAAFYNRAAVLKMDPVVTYKMEAFAPGAGLLNIERGKLPALRLRPWQTETSVSIKSWGYAENDSYRTATSLLCDLVDIVSKNGNLLLNVGPKADGTIPPEASAVLLEMGAWLKTNGEAIYDSRPWVMFGEGDTGSGAEEKKEVTNQAFTPSDIRFTRKGSALYVIGLAYADNNKTLVKTLYSGTPYLDGRIATIELLGSSKPVVWNQTPIGLSVELPERVALPYVLRIRMA
jgi:alpha-L-fucosidase